MKKILFGILCLIMLFITSSCDQIIVEQQDQEDIYLLAVEAGYSGTYEEWLETVKGDKGDPGVSVLSIDKTSSDGLVDTYTIKYSDGKTSTFIVTNGKDGINGIKGEPGADGHTPVITIQEGNWYIDGVNTGVCANGLKGETGNGISSIDKTSSEGLVDTYTITFTNGKTTTFTVTNGKDGATGSQGIQGIKGEPGADGHTPVITIQEGNWYIDGVNTGIKAEALDGNDGVGISAIEKTSTLGLIDTYTIYLTNGVTQTFTITNGSNGDDGLSAYEIYCKYYDYSKTEEEWINDLVNGNLSNNQKQNKKLTIAVYGDSISTKQNRNAVEITITSKDVGVKLSAYPTYHDIGTVINGYKITESDIGKELFFTPLAEDVGKTLGNVANFNPSTITTWWEHVEDYYNCNINPVCWSSSSYCSHENSTLRLTNSYSWHDSQIRKLGTRIEGTNERIAPDIVIMYRGCNDMTHAPYAKLTPNYFDDPEWKYPETDVVAGGWGYKEALALTIKKIREAYPNTIIVIATQATFRRIDSDNFPTNNNIYSLPAFNKATREVADFFGCHTIDFDKCRITYENCNSEGYLGDSLSSATHPTNKGHKVMGEQAIYDLMYKLHISPYIDEPIEENKLYEKTAVNHLGGELYDWDEYFSYDFIPVEEGATYYMLNCRNTSLLDEDGNVLSIVHGPTMEENGFLLYIPRGVKYIRTCARYDTISVDQFKIVKQDDKYIVFEKRAINGDGSYFDTNDYFAIDLIPVKENTTYYMPNCRNTVFLDSSGKVILSIGGMTMEANGFIATAPKGAVYVRTCARYDTISIDEFLVIEANDNQEEIDGLTTAQIFEECTLNIGYTLKGATGELAQNNSRLALSEYFEIDEYKYITINDKYQLCIIVYDENKKYIGNGFNFVGTWYPAGQTFSTNSIFSWTDTDYSNAKYIRIAIKAEDTHVLTKEDFFYSEVALYRSSIYSYYGEAISLDTVSSTNTLDYEKIAKLTSTQDGTIYGDYIFTFSGSGTCNVHLMSTKSLVSSFVLDKNDLSSPHSNSVCFGKEKYDENDEFPLLYTNIYNNTDSNGSYSPGVCNVYRIQREDNKFVSTLVQVIKVGFVSNNDLWPNTSNVRPYGNFLVDTDNNKLYSYVMIDSLKVTRYFSFNLPSASDGVYNESLQTNVIILNENDIIKKFDTSYSNYLQGGCYYKGKIYSLEGFANSNVNVPRLRVIDLSQEKQVSEINFIEIGITNEPELIFIENGTLYYATANGDFYKFSFK